MLISPMVSLLVDDLGIIQAEAVIPLVFPIVSLSVDDLEIMCTNIMIPLVSSMVSLLVDNQKIILADAMVLLVCSISAGRFASSRTVLTCMDKSFILIIVLAYMSRLEK